MNGFYYNPATELGYYRHDWSMLPANFPPNHLKWLNNQLAITQYNKKYGVQYDGGKLMNDFLAFVKNNRTVKQMLQSQ